MRGARPIADMESVEVRTVGIDVGSSTCHLMFAHLVLERLAQRLSSRFAVVERTVSYRSPVALTPYSKGGERIAARQLATMVSSWYREAGMSAGDVDTGVVLLTGNAVLRRNAKAIAERLVGDSGRFVCAAAGHHLEAVLAAHGSGAAALSLRAGQPVLNVDIGGGTTKLALVEDGAVRSTAAVAVGGRLATWGGDRRLLRVEPGAAAAGREAGVVVTEGKVLSQDGERRLCRVMAASLSRLVRGAPLQDLDRRLLLTPPLHLDPQPTLATCSGGVSEYLHGHGAPPVGDLGPVLAKEVREALTGCAGGPRLQPAENGIRATVIGTSQHSLQVSGTTVSVPGAAALPVHNLPVVRLRPGSQGWAASLREAALRRAQELAGLGAWAVAARWCGPPSHSALRSLADAVLGTLRELPQLRPSLLVVLLDADLASSLGRVISEEGGGLDTTIVCLDGIEAGETDYVDVAEPMQPSRVVPVVVKSLLFDHRADANQPRRKP